jgi:F-box interacting protein
MSEETTNMTLQPPSHSSSSSETLPFDLVTEIMCWLPVKFLLQLCCVCKSWNYIISHDSNFAKKQLRLSTSNHDRRHLILTPTGFSSEFLLCDFPISSIFSNSSVSTQLQLIRYPLTINYGHSFGGVSTCHGMLCFVIDESLALLCNPSIRNFKILPPLQNQNPDRSYVQTFYTLVYDHFTDNYKVISVSFCKKVKVEVNTHTLGTDYWKRIQDIPYQCFIRGLGVFVSDTVNWLAYDICSSLWHIVSLDLNKESYRKLFQPLYNERLNTSITLKVLRDCLCILSHGDKFSDIWIMKEYGNEESWTKLFSIPYMEGPGFLGYCQAVYISEDDQVLMQFLKMGKFSLLVYDSRNDTLKIPEIQNINGRMTPKTYVESLISPFF